MWFGNRRRFWSWRSRDCCAGAASTRPGYDVSGVLLAEKDRLPADLIAEVDVLAAASRHLRRDRELAFYGAEDLTPTGFYSREDAEDARAAARRTIETVYPHIIGVTDSVGRGSAALRR